MHRFEEDGGGGLQVINNEPFLNFCRFLQSLVGQKQKALFTETLIHQSFTIHNYYALVRFYYTLTTAHNSVNP